MHPTWAGDLFHHTILSMVKLVFLSMEYGFIGKLSEEILREAEQSDDGII